MVAGLFVVGLNDCHAFLILELKPRFCKVVVHLLSTVRGVEQLAPINRASFSTLSGNGAQTTQCLVDPSR